MCHHGLQRCQGIELDFVQGAVIVNLDPEGSAARSGIQENDIITRANGKNVTTTAELLEQFGRSKVGETLSLIVVATINHKKYPFDY
jgi:serine protease Do